MERGKEKEVNNSSVSSSVIHMDIVKLLDFIENLNDGRVQIPVLNMDQIEELTLELTFVSTFCHQYYYLDSKGCNAESLSCISIAIHDLVATLIRNREESLMDEENMKKICCASQDLLENIELLKEDLNHIFLKAPANSAQLIFPISDGPLFMTLLLRNLNDLLISNAYSVALIKEEISQMKEDLEHIRSFLGMRSKNCTDIFGLVFLSSRCGI
ncbi:hypothetical protein T459_35147 [Capsicum annuum]|uniref:Uncharacterized protein n=1 Tax=Capsicum annuum TaxID=4072 RepID=A0A2G2XU44_CAPAN|nr:hypothetical protein T459_35147 [Capsicum annuum]